MIKAVLIDKGSGLALHSESYSTEQGLARVLLVTSIPKTYGFFKSAAYTVQGTFEQVSPKGGESLEITDLIITFEKKASGVLSINFHDGTNTAPIVKTTLNDGPVNMVCNFVGKWQGWKDAHIDVIISGADAIGTVAIGYQRHTVEDTLTYAAWDYKR